jgi:hypothetical protein
VGDTFYLHDRNRTSPGRDTFGLRRGGYFQPRRLVYLAGRVWPLACHIDLSIFYAQARVNESNLALLNVQAVRATAGIRPVGGIRRSPPLMLKDGWHDQ